MVMPIGGNVAEFKRLLGALSNKGQLTSSTVSLPSYSQFYSPDSILGGTVGNPQVITGSGASAQSPLGSFYDTGQNIMGFNQDFLNQSFRNQGLQTALTAQYTDPLVDKNIDRARAGILFSQNTDPNRQRQINSAIDVAARMKTAQATAADVANRFGPIKVQTMNLA
tara:strand:- start:582 stop:1082 length:501 start_codon:yes stop_codon:yes gene_type:complete